MATMDPPFEILWKNDSGSHTLQGTGGTWQITSVTPTVATTTAHIPFNAHVNFEGMLATKEDYLQLVKMLSTCCLCGAEDCFVVCDLCKTAIVEVRNRMVGEMIEELRPHCA